MNHMKSVLTVHTTTNYSIFRILNGNRDLNQVHLARLKESIKKNYLLTILMVNEKYEIIDGNHRFTVIKELGLPVHFIMQKGYGLREVQMLNANTKNWAIVDYLNGYCDLGVKDYFLFREFLKDYGFSPQSAMLLLSGEYESGTAVSSISNKFKEGKFKVKNYADARLKAEKIMMLEPYYNGYLRRSFIIAMISLFKNPNFEFKDFLQKLKLQPTALKDCTNSTTYKILLEDIYNYRRKEKVNLRY